MTYLSLSLYIYIYIYVYVVQGTLGCTPVAVKMRGEQRPGRCKSRYVDILSELRVLRRSRHPNIALLHGACVKPSPAGDFGVVVAVMAVVASTRVTQCSMTGSSSR